MQEQGSQLRGMEVAQKEQINVDHNTGEGTLFMLLGMHLNPQPPMNFTAISNLIHRGKIQQILRGKSEPSQNDGGQKRQQPGSKTVSSYHKGGDYLGGCSGGQPLHCRANESDDAVS